MLPNDTSLQYQRVTDQNPWVFGGPMYAWPYLSWQVSDFWIIGLDGQMALNFLAMISH